MSEKPMIPPDYKALETVRRFHADVASVEPDGLFVTHEDYAKLLALAASLQADKERLQDEIERLKGEMTVTEQLLAERQRVLDAVPECPLHGPCVPHAVSWIEDQITRSAPETGAI